MTGPGQPDPWPLVGREQVLHDTLSQLRRRQGSGVVLLGEEGVGKSRLATEAVLTLRAEGLAVMRAVATAAAATLPFGALVDLLPPELQVAASPFDLMRQTAGRLRATAPRQGVVIAIDDAHLLDAASATLVGHLVRSGAARALLVIDDGKPVPDALHALHKDGPCVPLQVEPLGHQDLVRLCEAVLGGPVESSTLRRLVRLCSGNLMFLREVIDAGLIDGSLTERRGVWRLADTRIGSRRLASIVESRLGRLSDPVRTVVETVALAGTLELTLLERLTERRAVVGAERSRLITVSEDGRRLRVQLAHPLYAEVLCDTTPRLASRQHRSRLADGLTALGCHRKDDVLRLVSYRLEAGDVPDQELLLSAARSAGQLFDVHLAVRLATTAAQASGSFEARLAQAEALYACGRSDEAEPLLVALQAQAEGPDRSARIALARVSNLISGFGRASEAEALVRQAGDALSDGELRDEFTALGGMLALSQGRSQQALELAEPLLSRPGPPTRATARALLVCMSAWGQVGRADTAVVVGQQILSDAPEHELPLVMEVGLVGLCYAYVVVGQLDRAEELAHGRYDAALAQRAPDLRTLWSLALGQAALARGDLVGADSNLREAELLLRSDQSVLGVYSLAWCLGCLGEAAAARGDAPTARRAVQEAMAVTPEPCFIVSRELARIWLAWVEGSSEDAAKVALAVALEARELGQQVAEAFALHQMARLGQVGEVSARLHELAASVDGELVAAHAAHASAMADSDAGRLAAVSVVYERLGVWLDAAESAAQSSHCYASAGRKQSATGQAQRSAGLTRRCRGARTPGLQLLSMPQPLTAREREVAGLAARGWSTSDIARTLVLSLRTVDNHLHRAYGKLGISSRRELVELTGAGPAVAGSGAGSELLTAATPPDAFR